MISLFFNRQPSQALYEALDYEIPVLTGAQEKISLDSFLSFSTASVRSGSRRLRSRTPVIPLTNQPIL
jgi:hypothetical protein